MITILSEDRMVPQQKNAPRAGEGLGIEEQERVRRMTLLPCLINLFHSTGFRQGSTVQLVFLRPSWIVRTCFYFIVPAR